MPRCLYLAVASELKNCKGGLYPYNSGICNGMTTNMRWDVKRTSISLIKKLT